VNIHFLKAYAKVLWLFMIPPTRKFEITNEVKDIKNVSYSGKWGKHNTLDVHYPKNASGPLPIVAYVHGGGWAVGDKFIDTGYCRKLAESGFLVFNLNYGLGPKYNHPEPLFHLANAIEWIKANCAKYNGDKDRFFLAGDSAGAHLASLTACICTNRDLEKNIGIKAPLSPEQLKGLVLYYGAYDLNTILDTTFPLIKESVLAYTGTIDLNRYELAGQISPLHHITDSYPPVFLSSGEVDALHESQTVAMIRKLESIGIKHEELLFDKSVSLASHGFHVYAERECAMEALNSAVQFLKNHA
jgi:acetyl esterase/lipase